MSVVVIARFPVADVAAAKQSLADNGALLEEITTEALASGAHHHRFAEGGGDLLAIDEWESAEAFRGFFTDNAKIAKITEASGVQGPPVVEFFATVEAAGTF
ncbi:hypothetical protein FK531_12545 [Rhodococcus spelaei]|uniref:ABM domain-containing protein n=1 Tax=Rhodococcus spelaei TaxID=2546320 RepID=A0A541B8J2_9NOCA|nr:hypothetical protein [Rhodococcus spelaei]TQF68639.1 hypothetical protein FK531_12545 [Rhodococcus spelaei]